MFSLFFFIFLEAASSVENLSISSHGTVQIELDSNEYLIALNSEQFEGKFGKNDIFGTTKRFVLEGPGTFSVTNPSTNQTFYYEKFQIVLGCKRLWFVANPSNQFHYFIARPFLKYKNAKFSYVGYSLNTDDQYCLYVASYPYTYTVSIEKTGVDIHDRLFYSENNVNYIDQMTQVTSTQQTLNNVNK